MKRSIAAALLGVASLAWAGSAEVAFDNAHFTLVPTSAADPSVEPSFSILGGTLNGQAFK